MTFALHRSSSLVLLAAAALAACSPAKAPPPVAASRSAQAQTVTPSLSTAGFLANTSATGGVIYFPSIGTDLPNPAHSNVSGIAGCAAPQGAAYYEADHALVACFWDQKVLVVQASTHAVVASIDTTGKSMGTGTVAVSPDLKYAVLAEGGLVYTDDWYYTGSTKVAVIRAPFDASSTITTITLPGIVYVYQGQAVVFDPAGNAYVRTTSGISVLAPPYTSISYTIPLANGGAIAITPDGKQLLAPDLSNGNLVRVLNAPFSAQSTPAGSIAIPGAAYLDGIMVSPDGSNAILADSDTSKAWAIHAPFTASSVVEALPIPAGVGGFEDISISADGRFAVLAGNGDGLPLVVVQGPFTATGATAYQVAVPGSRGNGSFRFIPGSLIPGPTLAASAPATAATGTDVTVTLTYGNTGTAPLPGAVIQAPIPTGTTFVSATGGGTASAGTVTWELGSVPAGASATLSYVLHVTGAAGATLTVSGASLQSDDGTAVAPMISVFLRSTISFQTDGTPGASLTGSTTQVLAPGSNTSAVTANPPAGWVFANWTGSDGSTKTANPLVLTGVTDSLTLTAHFGKTTSLALASSLEPSTVLDAPTFTATITPAGATGDVQFLVDGAAFGAPVPVSGGVAVSAPFSTMLPASYAVTATFSGTAGYLAATGSLTQHVSAGPPSSVVVTPACAGQLAIAGGSAFAIPLTVTVLDVLGNPVTGTTVEFSGPVAGASATASPASVTTDSAGQASATATPNTVAGTYVVSAAAGAASAGITLTNAPGAAASLVADASSTPQSAVVGGASFPQPLGLTARDAHGNAVPAVSVTFGAPATGARAILSTTAATTDASGHVQITATSGSVAGAYAVTATTSGASSATFALRNEPGAAASLVATSGGGQHASVESTFAAPLVVTVADGFGNAVPGVQVSFSTPASAPTAVLAAATASTDASGRASVSATPDTRAGAYSVTATAAGLPGSASFSLVNDPGAPASLVADPSAVAQTAQVAGAFAAALGVTVQDQYGNPVPGVDVAFVAPVAEATAVLSLASVTTDSAGHAQVAATASSRSGAYGVTASLGALSATFSLTNSAGAPDAIQVVAGDGQHTRVALALASPLEIAVVDALGNPVPAATVSFEAPASGASAALSAGALSTDSNGRASVTAAAGTVAGAFQVTATVSGASSPAVFSLVNDPGDPVTVTASPAAGLQTAAVGSPFAVALAVSVKDAYENPVPGVSVDFVSPSSGPSAVLASASATTDAAGVASVQATANALTGAYVVTASVAGVGAPGTFSLRNAAGPPAVLTTVAGNGQSATVATAYAQALEVVVRDAHGNVAPDVPVSFSAPSTGASAVLSAATVLTDVDGKASVTATARTDAGWFAVVASAPGVSAPALFALRNEHATAATLALGAGASGQSARVGEPFASALALTVVDAHGNGVPGVVVTFACPSESVTCTLDATTATTDSRGRAVVHARAGTVPGTVDVVASAPGLPPTIFHLATLAGAPGSIAAVAGAAQSAPALSPYATPLTVVVKDGFGNVVPGAQVGFEVVTDGAQSVALSEASALTDASGHASVTATANAVKGSLLVRATAPGVAAPVLFPLENVLAPTQVTATVAASGVGGALHVAIAVGPAAGDRLPSGSVTLRSAKPLTVVGGAHAVVSGDAVVVTLVDGAAEVDVQGVDLRAGSLQADYAPDAAAASTFAASTVTVPVTLGAQADAGGCSTAGGASWGILPLLALGLRRRRGRRL